MSEENNYTSKDKTEFTVVTLETIVKNIEENDLVLLDFFADWCPPCKSQGELLESDGYQINNEFPNIKFCKMNTEDDNGLSNYLEINYIPNIFIFYKKNIGRMHHGFRDIDEIIAFIKEFTSVIDEREKCGEINPTPLMAITHFLENPKLAMEELEQSQKEAKKKEKEDEREQKRKKKEIKKKEK